MAINHNNLLTESIKKMGVCLALFVNERWCNSGHITVKAQVCTVNVDKLLSDYMLPDYMPLHDIVFVLYAQPVLM